MPDHAKGQHGKWMRFDAIVHAFALDTYAPSSVGMVYENKFSSVGMGFFDRRELSWFWPERFFLGTCMGDEYEKDEV